MPNKNSIIISLKYTTYKNFNFAVINLKSCYI